MPEPQTLLTGLAMGESPRWHEDRLWLSDMGANEVVTVDLEGTSEVVASVLPAIRHEHRTSLQMDMGTSDGPDRTLG
jgi:sugar lactone lactonase YvrE